MRTSPDAFQGLGREGIEIIKNLKEEHNFEFVTEITDPRQVEILDGVVDMYQVGSRNMYNYDLLRELNNCGKPVLFKRAFSATVKEWLNACNYMPDLGEEKVILCERGIRTFETTTRNTLDINSVVYLKQNHNFKVIVDPSHAAGIRSMVRPLSHIAMASGADGILIESHPTPESALSDKDQQVTPEELNSIREDLIKMSSIFNKEVI
jgi:3-deoxy-7-phosphoheptulonate synthase